MGGNSALTFGLRSLLVGAIAVGFGGGLGWREAPTPVPPSAPKRIALLVGISNYAQGSLHKDGWGSLSTQPDLANIARVLRDQFAFSDIHTILDAEATQQGIVDTFRSQLLAKADPGDAVVFYYSGHGHQVRNEDGGDPEPDGLDEVLVTWLPKADQSLPDHARLERMYFRDDRLQEMFAELTKKMSGTGGKFQGSVTVILDSCNSGSGAKGAARPKGRTWSEELDGPLPKGLPRPEAGGWDAQGSYPEGFVLISGCESGQFSYMMDEPSDGSALTYYLCQRLTDVSQRGLQDVSYKDAFEWIRVRVYGDRPNQNPQLEGAVDTLLFGDGTSKAQLDYVRVSKVSSAAPFRVTMESGSLAGVTPGCAFELYGAGTDVGNPSNKLADVEIDSADAFTSTGVVRGPSRLDLDRAQLVAARAKLVRFSPKITPLRVWIEERHPLRARIEALPFVSLSGVGPDDFDVRFDTRGPNQYQRKTGATVQWEESESSQIVQRLQSEWRWKELTKLSAPPKGPRVELDLLYVAEGAGLGPGDTVPLGVVRPARRSEGGGFLMEPSDEAVLVCRNLSGRSLYMTVLYLDLRGNVFVFPENALAQQSVPPDRVPHVLLQLKDPQEPWGTEVFKLIATESQVDLSGLRTPAAHRSASKGVPTPLHELLYGIVDGIPKGPSISLGSDQMTWGVAELALTSRPTR